MVTRGGGHGSFHNIVLAPSSSQEMTDFAYRAFDLADAYRMVVIILTDAYIGQMMEPVGFPDSVKHARRKSWALYADAESRSNLITSIVMSQKGMSDHNIKLQEKYRRVKRDLTDWEETYCDDAEYLFVAFGITARVASRAVELLRTKGVKAGLLRPKTLFPFPSERIKELSSSVRFIAVAELNNGMMANDVELALSGACPVLRYNWFGGIVPGAEDLASMLEKDIVKIEKGGLGK
jgi:pyruvate/2-oxoacid:ferredoxin oxidoreductase alpha subunit